MADNFNLSTVPVDLSATLAAGRYLCQFQGTFVGFYGAVPASEPAPVNTGKMYVVSNFGYFVVNVGLNFDPVWVVGEDYGAGAGQLVIEGVG